MNTKSASGGGGMVITVAPAVTGEAVSLPEGESVDTDMAGFRLFVQQGGCADPSYGVHFDNEPKDDSTVVEQHSLRVFVDPADMNYIGDSTLDFEGSLQDADFHVDNPSTESSYDCGESFRT